MEIRHFWWVVFPIMGFGLGAFRMWLRYRQQREMIDLLRTYADQGKEPPEALTKVVESGACGPPWAWGRRAGPYWDWRRAAIFTALAGGFFVASRLADRPGAVHAMASVAAVMGFLAAASILLALVSTFAARSAGRNDPRNIP